MKNDILRIAALLTALLLLICALGSCAGLTTTPSGQSQEDKSESEGYHVKDYFTEEYKKLYNYIAANIDFDSDFAPSDDVIACTKALILSLAIRHEEITTSADADYAEENASLRALSEKFDEYAEKFGESDANGVREIIKELNKITSKQSNVLAHVGSAFADGTGTTMTVLFAVLILGAIILLVLKKTQKKKPSLCEGNDDSEESEDNE